MPSSVRSVARSWRRLLDIRVVLAVIAAVGIGLLAVDLATGSGPETEGDTFARIDSFVDFELDASRIPGIAVAVVEDGRALHVRGFGNDGNGNAITADTPFWIGSNTKSYTALSVMQLVEAGEVELDAPVQRYLPEFTLADEEAAASITVRHLLNQTSGFSRADGIEPLLEESDASLDETVAALADVELNRPPVGESYEYSNLNFVVLGQLVEEVAGQSWASYIEENVFQPLGMTRSYSSEGEAQAEGLTATHRYAFGFPFESETRYMPGLAPTGYLYSTAADMARYLAMYLNGGELDGARLLSESGISYMLTGSTNTATVRLQSHAFEAQYGAGWFVGAFGVADDARWHQGSLPTFTAWMVLLPESGQAAIALMNAGNQFEFGGANSAFSRIPLGVVNILRDEPPPEGISVKRFFIIFNTMVLAIIAVQVWSLGRVARPRRRGPVSRRRTFLGLGPLTWELGVGVTILIAWPLVLGLAWGTSFQFIPDLTLVLLTVSGLWIATGLLRVGRWAQWAARARRNEPPPPEVTAAPTS